ncbi:unnamed protein product [Psylliodes chrysocephalus]|uniref:Uncharacterized protein n=1 Tax=Psylliodes chrysocephalus TaxID=3402493 RepID=A0A9P0CZ00_9CUCU|nr:unnamed protein product [Psylliodes chrysocephala]
MKIAIFGFVLFIVIVNATSSPVAEAPEELSRDKRFTCENVLNNLQNGPSKLNEAYCASRCILNNYQGEWCDQNKRYTGFIRY